MYNNTFDVSCRRVHVSMATKALQGDTYLYETSSAKRDFFLAKLGIQTYLVVTDGANDTPHPKKKQKTKEKQKQKIKLKKNPFATLPRVASAPVNIAE